MGGVAGHMDHLYENPSLSFDKMKEILEAASNGELTAEEKVDGQNLFLSYSLKDKKAKGARNKGNLRQGGLDASGLAAKFAGRGGLETAFNQGFEAFEVAVDALSDREKEAIFGPDANTWYNAEIMDPGTENDPNDPGSVNVIKYDDKTLKIHNVGHFIFDRETGEKKDIHPRSLQILDRALNRMQQRLHGNKFNLARQAIIQLQKIENDEILNTTVQKIDSAISSAGLTGSDTVQDYVKTRIIDGLSADLDIKLREELANYLLELPGNIGLRAIKKGQPQSRLDHIVDIVTSKRNILNQAVEPLEHAIHDFTVELLKGLKSVFIADNTKEVSRLRKELSIAVQQLVAQGADDPEAMQIVQRHLNKIKDFSHITTPVEAVVFDYDGHTYKFAGNFAPLNQILGMFRYPKHRKKVTQESINFDTQVITEKDGKKVALLPGGFKPPHAGHYGLAKKLSSEPGIDEVIVIIGKKPRFSDMEPKVEITARQSKNLWDLYTSNDKNIKVRIQEGSTPVSDVYDLIADKNSFSEGDTVILGKSDKDVGDKRYARAQSWAAMHNPGVNVEEMIFPVIGGKNMGGRDLRDMIAGRQQAKLISKLPEHLSDEEKERVWNIVSRQPNDTLNLTIDDHIDEISAMSTGAVEGSEQMHGFGPANKYNPWTKRGSKKKPQIRRAKRQRRR